MPGILRFVLLVLFHQHIQPAWSQTLALPLAVRSPYLSCWLPQIRGTAIRNYYDAPVTTISDLSKMQDLRIFVRVDNTTYSIIGSVDYPNGFQEEFPVLSANITNRVVTPTQTITITIAGPMQVNVTFLNPVEPKNWVKQSIPFSYISLSATSLDNAAHSIQVYSDISSRWISDATSGFSNNVTSTIDVTYHTITFSEPLLFSEVANQAGWGTIYYAMKTQGISTFDEGQNNFTLEHFSLSGVPKRREFGTTALNNATTFFSFSHDLGTIQVTKAPIAWAIGYTTDPAISYANQSTTSSQQRRPYYKSQYANDELLIIDFLNDFSNASQRAQQLDQKILMDAASVSELLGDLVSLAVPRVYGSFQLTIGTDESGNLDVSDTMMFVKDISRSTPNRVNAVETLYAAFPALMYIDPSLGKPLLEPLLRFQASPDYGIAYAARDLGSSYPNVTTSRSQHSQGVEQTGNMLIMTYAYARASGDGSLISRYYSLLTSWANYLSNSSVDTANQLEADGVPDDDSFPSNKTNLAIKGIIAIEAMSAMSLAAGEEADASKYKNISNRLYSQWKTVAFGTDGGLRAFEDQPDSWTLGYNLFADVWLGTNVVESSVYDNQSNFLANILNASYATPYSNGTMLPFSFGSSSFFLNRGLTVTSWYLFVAAMTPNGTLRSDLIKNIHDLALLYGNYSGIGAFPHGYGDTGIGSPAQGAVFAPLFQKIPVKDIQFKTTATISQSKKSHVGVVARSVISTVTALLLLGAAIIGSIWYRRRYNTTGGCLAFSSGVIEIAPGGEITPFVPSSPEMILGDPVTGSGWQQPQSWVPAIVSTDADGHNPYSSPAGLHSQLLAPVPVGLSAKELARMRAENLPSRPAINTIAENLVGDASGSQSPPLPATATEQRETPTSVPLFRTLQSQVDRIWREIGQLQVRAERSGGSEVPPSYAENEASHHGGGVQP